MPTRSWSDASRAYRYGFNGKEKDFETANDDYDFGARIYDGRLGRWLSLDPEILDFSGISNYVGVNNNPLFCVDRDGKKIIIYYEVEVPITVKNGDPVIDSITGKWATEMEIRTFEYEPNLKNKNSNQFVSQACEALDYVYNGSRKGRREIKKAIKAKYDVKIHQTTGQNYSLPVQYEGVGNDQKIARKDGNPIYLNDVYWNPNTKLRVVLNNGTKTTNTISAAVCLIHEILHVSGSHFDFYRFENGSKELNSTNKYFIYDTYEELRVIKIERKIAGQLNENKRYNHRGDDVPNSGVTDNANTKDSGNSSLLPTN